MSDYYILGADGEPCPADDVSAWAKWYEKADRSIAHTLLAPGLEISTVFLGVDHSFSSGGPPVLYETMVFGGDWSEQEMLRYATLNGARKGHAEIVTKVVNSLTKG